MILVFLFVNFEKRVVFFPILIVSFEAQPMKPWLNFISLFVDLKAVWNGILILDLILQLFPI